MDKAQTKANNYYSKDDDVEYFVKLMDESRDMRNTKITHQLMWMQNGRHKWLLLKAYRRILSRREEANIFAILDKKK